MRSRVAAALLAAPWVAWALVRALGLDTRHPVVAAVSFTPYAALTSPIPVVGALILRSPAVAGVSAAAALVLVGAVVPRAFGGPDPRSPADGPRLVVMTSNVLFGRADMGEVLRLVREHDVDVLSLQEITPEALERFDAAGGRELLPARAVDALPGAAGTGLLARRPLRRIPNETGEGAAQPEAVLELPGAPPLIVRAVHPYPPTDGPGVRTWQQVLRSLPGSGPELRLIAGDFNATLDHRALRKVLDRGYADAADVAGEGLVPTWPDGGRVFKLAIDHVLVDRRIAVEDVAVHRVAGSDHRAVIAKLRLPSGGPDR